MATTDGSDGVTSPQGHKLPTWVATLDMSAEVPRVPLASLTRRGFRDAFQQPNLPVIITGVTSDWRAAREWVDERGRPDVRALLARFGTDLPVPVSDGRGRRREMRLGEFVELSLIHI